MMPKARNDGFTGVVPRRCYTLHFGARNQLRMKNPVTHKAIAGQWQFKMNQALLGGGSLAADDEHGCDAAEYRPNRKRSWFGYFAGLRRHVRKGELQIVVVHVAP
jgi:hypothetical protein